MSLRDLDLAWSRKEVEKKGLQKAAVTSERRREGGKMKVKILLRGNILEAGEDPRDREMEAWGHPCILVDDAQDWWLHAAAHQ